ncbi:MAG: chaperone protein DnaK [Myxococcales bacterium]
MSAVVGIDLGTTNSLVCIHKDGPVLVPVDGDTLVPSVVALGLDGEVVVGRAARNLWAAAPERVIRSAKRRMGEDVALPLGERTMSPVEVSALVLRRLKLAAEGALGAPVTRAVITVPAWFTDAQRTATREAGEVAGFTVERILNEPTAASLCYGDETDDRTWLVYDLGGGTFDVSVVRASRGVTEVLASHGDTKLGGDDFDEALTAHLEKAFTEATGARVEGLRARTRLLRAAEEAKIRLSTEPFVRVMEEALGDHDGVPRHLDVEVSRHDYERLIQPFLERTRRSVQTALRDAGVLAKDLDDVLLVGGSSRTPRVRQMLHDMLGREPRMDVDPDRAVALGAGLQAARVAGDRSARVLVDVTPYTFGTRVFGVLHGVPGPRVFHPIIRRNSALPARQTDVLYTIHPGQTRVEVDVLQGEDDDADQNLQVGNFRVEGLDPNAPEGSPVLFDFRLDLDGILTVTVTERATGLSKGVTIKDAFRTLTSEEQAAARERVASDLAHMEEAAPPMGHWTEDVQPREEAPEAVARARQMLPRLSAADRAEVEGLLAEVAAAEGPMRDAALAALSDVLFYLE